MKTTAGEADLVVAGAFHIDASTMRLDYAFGVRQSQPCACGISLQERRMTPVESTAQRAHRDNLQAGRKQSEADARQESCHSEPYPEGCRHQQCQRNPGPYQASHAPP